MIHIITTALESNDDTLDKSDNKIQKPENSLQKPINYLVCVIIGVPLMFLIPYGFDNLFKMTMAWFWSL